MCFRRSHSLHACFGVLLALQALYWWHARPYQPDLSIVPNVPRAEAVKAISMGDEEFYFRTLALMLQNAGDTFGRATPLKNYDFTRLQRWFGLLDQLNSRSNMIPAMAAYYYSQSQNEADARYIVDYLYAHASRDVEHKWWWLIQAIYLSMHKLHDMELTLKVAQPLLNADVPAWAQQMLAVVYEKRGEMGDALRIMETIKEHAKQMTDADLKYMKYFIDERIKKLDDINKNKQKPEN